MKTTTSRPNFLVSYLSALQRSAHKRGWRALIPLWFMACLSVGIIVAYYIPGQFWTFAKGEMATAVYVGILTLNGLILVLSWNAFLRMQEIISDGDFGSYLYDRELLNDYLFYMQYINTIQILAMLSSAIGLILFLCDIQTTANRVALAFNLAVSAYAIKQASAAVTAMHDLIWQKAIFDSDRLANRSEAGFVVRKEDSRARS